MPSRAELARRILERLARGGLLLLLAILVFREARRPEVRGADESTGSALAGALPRWTVGAPERVAVSFERAPTRVELDWLAALRAAGTPVTWSASTSAAIAASTEAVRAPGDWVRADIAAPPQSSVVLTDDAGALDTLVAEGGGASLTLPGTWGDLRASVSGWEAVSAPPSRTALRRVLVLANAGWEAKFAVVALEEAGWQVDAVLALRPDAGAVQGERSMPDTARHAAVVVLDSVSPATAARIASYVQSGGGLVIGPGAWTMRALRALLPGQAGRIIASRPGANSGTVATMPAQTIVPVAEARTVARRGQETVVAARRIESGRVLQFGYPESWRLRMMGPDGGVQSHRDWWSGLVSAVAYAPYEPAARLGDEAPLARMTAVLGAPSGLDQTMPGGPASSGALMALLFMLLLGEIASRRLRGAR